MRGCRNLTFDFIQKYASLSQNFHLLFSTMQQNFTISEPHYLLFYSADCKYTAAIRQRLLLHIQLSNSFLIGRKPTVSFRNQRP